jgi:hypothetical protein
MIAGHSHAMRQYRCHGIVGVVKDCIRLKAGKLVEERVPASAWMAVSIAVQCVNQLLHVCVTRHNILHLL